MDEQALINQVLSGDERAFEQLTRLHERQLFALSLQILQNRQDAEDVCVETFIRAFQHLRELRPQPSLAPWLRRTATNLCLSALRRRKTHREDLMPEVTVAIDYSDPAHEVSQRDDARYLRLCMEQMSPAERTMLTLRYVEDKSLEEVAELLGRPRSLLKVQLHRARKRLERLYTQLLSTPRTEVAARSEFLIASTHPTPEPKTL